MESDETGRYCAGVGVRWMEGRSAGGLREDRIRQVEAPDSILPNKPILPSPGYKYHDRSKGTAPFSRPSALFLQHRRQ